MARIPSQPLCELPARSIHLRLWDLGAAAAEVLLAVPLAGPVCRMQQRLQDPKEKMSVAELRRLHRRLREVGCQASQY